MSTKQIDSSSIGCCLGALVRGFLQAQESAKPWLLIVTRARTGLKTRVRLMGWTEATA